MSRFNLDLLARAASFVAGRRPDAQPDFAATEPAPLDFEGLAIATATALARRFEGLYLQPYLCPAGVPTVGYGATYYEDGTRVTLRDPAITRERAEALLFWHVRNVYLPVVRKLCPNIDTPERLAAIIDFAFNLGTTNLRTSTLRKRILAGAWDDVPAELRKWVMAGGKRLRGLELRRGAECLLIPKGRS